MSVRWVVGSFRSRYTPNHEAREAARRIRIVDEAEVTVADELREAEFPLHVPLLEVWRPKTHIGKFCLWISVRATKSTAF